MKKTKFSTNKDGTVLEEILPDDNSPDPCLVCQRGHVDNLLQAGKLFKLYFNMPKHLPSGNFSKKKSLISKTPKKTQQKQVCHPNPVGLEKTAANHSHKFENEKSLIFLGEFQQNNFDPKTCLGQEIHQNEHNAFDAHLPVDVIYINSESYLDIRSNSGQATVRNTSQDSLVINDLSEEAEIVTQMIDDDSIVADKRSIKIETTPFNENELHVKQEVLDGDELDSRAAKPFSKEVSVVNEENYLTLQSEFNSSLSVHYFCVLFSKDSIQRGYDDEGVFGFMANDILNQVEAAQSNNCSFCSQGGASINCGHKGCSKLYHYPCGVENDVVFYFHGRFSSRCDIHRNYGRPPKGQECDPIDDPTCLICLEEVEHCLDIKNGPKDKDQIASYRSNERLTSGCCGRHFHRNCIQQMALTHGRSHFKCPQCSNKPVFTSLGLRSGIYIPIKDAEWEMGEHSEFYMFQEMSEYRKCCANVCFCPDGRKHSVDWTPFEVIPCEICGSSGVHVQCGKLPAWNLTFVCKDCKEVVDALDQATCRKFGLSKCFVKVKKVDCPGQTVLVARTETGNYQILHAVEANWTVPQLKSKKKLTKPGLKKKRAGPTTTKSSGPLVTVPNFLKLLKKKSPVQLSGPLLQSLKKVHAESIAEISSISKISSSMKDLLRKIPFVDLSSSMVSMLGNFFSTSPNCAASIQRIHILPHSSDPQSLSSNFQGYGECCSVRGRLSCESCAISFERTTELYSHYKAVHRDERPFSCPNCEFTCASKFRLQKHVEKLLKKPFICPICSLTLARKKQFKDHFMKVHNKKFSIVIQKDESSSLQRASELSFPPAKKQKLLAENSPCELFKAIAAISHVDEVATETHVVCNARESLIEQKQNLIPQQQPEKNSNSTCTIRPTGSFTSSQGIKQYYKSGGRTCSDCRAIFVNKTELFSHQRAVHSKERPFFCKSCDFASQYKIRLKNHVRFTHDKERSFFCNFCDHAAYSQWHLERHVGVVHYNKRAFDCHLCQRSFGQKHGLIKHLNRIHPRSGGKIRKFRTKQNLSKVNTAITPPTANLLADASTCAQLRESSLDLLTNKYISESLAVVQHNSESPEQKQGVFSQQQPVKNLISRPSTISSASSQGIKNNVRLSRTCINCSGIFADTAELYIHQKGVHWKERPFFCNICNYTSASNSQLRRHVEVVHYNEKLFVCQFCQRKFGQKENLKKHLKAKHQMESKTIFEKIESNHQVFKEQHFDVSPLQEKKLKVSPEPIVKSTVASLTPKPRELPKKFKNSENFPALSSDKVTVVTPILISTKIEFPESKCYQNSVFKTNSESTVPRKRGRPWKLSLSPLKPTMYFSSDMTATPNKSSLKISPHTPSDEVTVVTPVLCSTKVDFSECDQNSFNSLHVVSKKRGRPPKLSLSHSKKPGYLSSYVNATSNKSSLQISPHTPTDEVTVVTPALRSIKVDFSECVQNSFNSPHVVSKKRGRPPKLNLSHSKNPGYLSSYVNAKSNKSSLQISPHTPTDEVTVVTPVLCSTKVDFSECEQNFFNSPHVVSKKRGRPPKLILSPSKNPDYHSSCVNSTLNKSSLQISPHTPSNEVTEVTPVLCSTKVDFSECVQNSFNSPHVVSKKRGRPPKLSLSPSKNPDYHSSCVNSTLSKSSLQISPHTPSNEVTVVTPVLCSTKVDFSECVQNSFNSPHVVSKKRGRPPKLSLSPSKKPDYHSSCVNSTSNKSSLKISPHSTLDEVTVVTPILKPTKVDFSKSDCDKNSFFKSSSESTVLLPHSVSKKRGRPRKLNLSPSKTTMYHSSNVMATPNKSLLQIYPCASSGEVTVISPHLVTPKLGRSPTTKYPHEQSNEVTVMPKILGSWSLSNGTNELMTNSDHIRKLTSGSTDHVVNSQHGELFRSAFVSAPTSELVDLASDEEITDAEQNADRTVQQSVGQNLPYLLSNINAEDKTIDQLEEEESPYVLSNEPEYPKPGFVEQNFIEVDFENIDSNQQRETPRKLVKNPFYMPQRNDSESDIVLL